LLQQSLGNATEAETCFHHAIIRARSQQAKSLELRAATSLARLWQQQGKREGSALHVMLCLANPMRTLFVFNGLRSCHCQRASLGYHYPLPCHVVRNGLQCPQLPPLPKPLPCEKWRAKDGEVAP